MDEMEQVMTDALHDSGDVLPAEDAGQSEEVAAAAATDPAKAEGAPEDPFLEEFGVPQRRPDGRENRIPHSRVQKIAAARERRAAQAIGKVFGIEVPKDGDYKLETLIQELTGRHTKYGEFEKRAATWDQLEPIARDHPDHYIQMLAKANPAYGKFLKVLEAGGTVDEAEAAAGDQDDPEPLPDMPVDPNNPNGPKQYSIEQLQKARAWDRRQAERGAERKLAERLKPFEEKAAAEKKAAEEKARQEEIDRIAGEAVDRLLKKAQKWPHFAEHADEILKRLQADQTGELDLYDVYHAIVFPKLAADRTKVRGEVIADMQKTPSATSAGAQRAAPTKDTAEQTMEEAMIAAMRAAGIRPAA